MFVVLHVLNCNRETSAPKIYFRNATGSEINSRFSGSRKEFIAEFIVKISKNKEKDPTSIANNNCKYIKTRISKL